MTERLRQIELLHHTALELDESGWAAFLDSACEGDEGLRREVESLLYYSKHAADFLETPALGIMAKELASKQREEQGSRRDDAKRTKKYAFLFVLMGLPTLLQYFLP